MGPLILLSAVLAVTLADNYGYDDPFARNQMLPLAAAAYSGNPQLCMTNIFGQAQIKRLVSVKCDALHNDICAGYTGVINNSQFKAIVVSFRGTQGFLQLIEEANKSIFGSWINWSGGGEVSKYFGDAFNQMWAAGMKDDFNSLKNAYPGYEVWITGHSLGGAIASLAASYIVNNGLATASQIKLVTFGQPRTGNHAFSSAHDSQLPYSFRVVHWRDMVPHVPNENFEGYYHHKYEAFYQDDMKSNHVTVCDHDEDKKCSDGLTFTASIEEHLHYFNKDVSEYGEKGCK